MFDFDAGGSVRVQTENCSFPNRGTFNWQLLDCSFTASAAHTEVRVKVGWRGIGSGLLGIDDVRLVPQ
ncbi:MAG: hypothetical protein GYB64_09810 [Chloroflexi bacterium]|nr:hypothetical protein [Chloroflexota bacterium]